MKAAAAILVCFLALASSRPAQASPIVTTNPGDLAGATLIDFEDLAVAAITDQYADKGVTFSAGLHAETTFPPLVPGGAWGSIAATNGDPGCCPSITMSFSTPLRALGFEIISQDAAVTNLDIFTLLNGVQTFAGNVVFDTSFEVKFFGILANPADANPLFDQVIISAIGPPAPGVPAAFVLDNLQLEAVPEPATLTMLGLGSAALWARRRRAQRAPRA